MKARGAAVQGGLAALGLMVAYATWQRAPEARAGDVTVLNLGRGDIQSIHTTTGRSSSSSRSVCSWRGISTWWSRRRMFLHSI